MAAAASTVDSKWKYVIYGRRSAVIRDMAFRRQWPRPARQRHTRKEKEIERDSLEEIRSNWPEPVGDGRKTRTKCRVAHTSSGHERQPQRARQNNRTAACRWSSDALSRGIREAFARHSRSMRRRGARRAHQMGAFLRMIRETPKRHAVPTASSNKI